MTQAMARHPGRYDEFHEHKPNLYDTMATGMGSRDQGLMFIITTAGSTGRALLRQAPPGTADAGWRAAQ